MAALATAGVRVWHSDTRALWLRGPLRAANAANLLRGCDVALAMSSPAPAGTPMNVSGDAAPTADLSLYAPGASVAQWQLRVASFIASEETRDGGSAEAMALGTCLAAAVYVRIAMAARDGAIYRLPASRIACMPSSSQRMTSWVVQVMAVRVMAVQVMAVVLVRSRLIQLYLRIGYRRVYLTNTDYERRVYGSCQVYQAGSGIIIRHRNKRAAAAAAVAANRSSGKVGVVAMVSSSSRAAASHPKQQPPPLQMALSVLSLSRS